MRIAVILSTFNGEKYIKEQIDSILKQKGVDVDLYVRDDGSKDSTIKILKNYTECYSNIHINIGANIGFAKSFFTELFYVEDYEFYSFSDQDDYWYEEKLYNACKILKSVQENKPSVYYSNLEVCTENLDRIKVTKLENRTHTLESVTTRRSIAGCTIVFNKEMYSVLKSSKDPNVVVGSHDNYIISLCYAVGGRVICDKNTYIKYRQHGANTSGPTNSFFKRIQKEIKEIKKNSCSESFLAESLIKNYSNEITESNRKILEQIRDLKISKIQRIKAFFSPKFTTGHLLLTVFGKIKIILGFL